MVIQDPTFACPLCVMNFFTQVGRDDHVQYRHQQYKGCVMKGTVYHRPSSFIPLTFTSEVLIRCELPNGKMENVLVQATNGNPYHSDRSGVKDIHVEDNRLVGTPDNGDSDETATSTETNGWEQPVTTGTVDWDKQSQDFNMKSASRRSNPNGKKQR